MWLGSPDWPSSQRTHLLPMSAAHVLNNCNDKLATAKLGPNSIALAADGEAAKLLARWGGAFLAPEKIEQLLAGAGASVGVRLGEWPQRQIQNYAQQALGSSVLKCEAWDFSVFCRSQSFC